MYFLDKEDFLSASSGILTELVKVTLILLFSFILNSSSFDSSELWLSIPVAICSLTCFNPVTTKVSLLFTFSSRRTLVIRNWVSFRLAISLQTGLTHSRLNWTKESSVLLSAQLQSCCMFTKVRFTNSLSPVMKQLVEKSARALVLGMSWCDVWLISASKVSRRRLLLTHHVKTLNLNWIL